MIKSWDQITIEKWRELSQITSDNEATKLINTFSILLDRDIDEIRGINLSEFREMQSQFAWVSEPPKADVKTKFEIGGKKYGMIPQLDFITAGEWLDAESWKEDSVNNIHFYCALLWRPIVSEDGDTWQIEPHKTAGFLERAELFLKELPITFVYGAVLFFLSSVIGCMESIQVFLEQTQPKEKLMKTNQTQRPTKKRKK